MAETNQETNEEPEEKKNNQITGNTGMYYVCYQLSRRKWNAMPTSRNAKGIDIVAYSNTGKCVGIQVKTISNLVNICFGKKVEYIFDYLVIVALGAFSNKDDKEKDEHVVYILSKEETKQMMSQYGKDKNSWLRIDLINKNKPCFQNNWDKIVKNNRDKEIWDEILSIYKKMNGNNQFEDLRQKKSGRGLLVSFRRRRK